jgi:splicing suppressor protein 51
MAGEHTCGRCLQVLRNGTRAQDSLRIQSLARSRRCHPLVRSYGSLPNSRLASRTPPKANPRTPSPSPNPRVLHNAESIKRAVSTSSGYAAPENRALLRPNNLFHPFSKSPSRAIRQRAALIAQNAFCPHPSHQQTRLPVSPHDPEARKSRHGGETLAPAHSHFECPDCGVPIYCSEGHWVDDFEAHLEICDTIRQINEDDHDLHSGRFFPEFSYPGLQEDNFVINMSNWDSFLYTREFDAINHDRSMRQVTRMLTYPVTIGSVLHELSPYSVRKEGRLTVEGLKSVTGELHDLHMGMGIAS